MLYLWHIWIQTCQLLVRFFLGFLSLSDLKCIFSIAHIFHGYVSSVCAIDWVAETVWWFRFSQLCLPNEEWNLWGVRVTRFAFNSEPTVLIVKFFFCFLSFCFSSSIKPVFFWFAQMLLSYIILSDDLYTLEDQIMRDFWQCNRPSLRS